MTSNIRPSAVQLFALFLTFGLGLPVGHSQEKPQVGKSIDIDKALQGKVEQDRAGSYFHYSLAKWFEDKGDLSRALSEMEKAAKLNESSSSVRVELAKILAQAGQTNEALEEAEEATRLDPKAADPYWLRATIYSRTSSGGSNKDPRRMSVCRSHTRARPAVVRSPSLRWGLYAVARIRELKTFVALCCRSHARAEERFVAL